MALTPGGTPYVESSDLVADYPTVSLALAEHIDDLPAKILQVVRATDATARTTSSSSFVDASLSVTITPQKSTSAIILIWVALINTVSSGRFMDTQITDNDNNGLSGSELARTQITADIYFGMSTSIGYSTPGTTAATTYKARFKAGGGNVTLENSTNTGQIYAIEVSA